MPRCNALFGDCFWDRNYNGFIHITLQELYNPLVHFGANFIKKKSAYLLDIH